MRLIVAVLVIVLVGLSYPNIEAHKHGKTKKKHHHHHHSGSDSGSTSVEVHKHIKVTCPKYNVFDIDLAESANSYWNTLQWFDILWNTPNPPISSKAAAFRDVARNMVKGDVPKWRFAASTMSYWVWSTLPLIAGGASPNMCGFTKIINATIWSNSEILDCDLLSEALSEVIDTVCDYTEYMKKITRINAGCRPGKEPKLTARTCYKNGDAFDSDAFWNIRGKDFPCGYQKAARALSQSSHFQDRFIGTIAHAVASQPMIDLYNNFNQTNLGQGFALITVPEIERYCCKSLNFDLEETASWVRPNGDHAKNLVLLDNGCTI